MRLPPPLLGWLLLFVVLLAICSIVGAGGVTLLALDARREYVAKGGTAAAIIDTVRVRRCVFLEPGDRILRRPPGR